jgi:hypothetical protein
MTGKTVRHPRDPFPRSPATTPNSAGSGYVDRQTRPSILRAHAQLRSPGERANAQLKNWHILRKLRCCPWQAGQLAKAIHVLQARESEG